MTILQLHEVKKEFGEDVLLENIDLKINSGDRIGFVGTNGSGKTTLFKMIAGIVPYENGTITIPSGTRIGYLEQHPLINSNETIYNTLLHGFDNVISEELRLRELENEITALTESDSKYESTLKAYGDLLENFEEHGGYSYVSEIKGVLRGLGFMPEEFDKLVSECSGGQRTRIAIAQILLEKPDILLLDEPTNHLDLTVVRWLEGHLKNYKGTVLIISHDRYFLDNICTGIAEIENKGLLYFEGDFTGYYEKKKKLNEILEKQYTLQQREIKRLQGIIDTFRSYNREKSIKQARSKEKQLAKIKLVTSPFRSEKINMSFSVDRESGSDVLFVEDVSKSFGNRELFKDFSMHVCKGDRIAIIGENGCGKTTLLKIITGIIQPDSGEVRYGSRVSTGYYDQSVAGLHPEKDILSEIYDDFPHLEITYIRTVCGIFLFKGDDVFKTINSLSGGEKARVMLIKLMLRHDNLLLLDEPTNHLDVDSKAVLEDALDSFDGTIIAVSHDRYFINRIADYVYVMENGVITKYIGNYDDYIEKISADESELEGNQQAMTKTELHKQQKKEKSEQKAKSDQKKRIKELEQRIDDLEKQKAELEEMLADESVYKDQEKLKNVNIKYNDVCTEIDSSTEEWLMLSEETDA